MAEQICFHSTEDNNKPLQFENIVEILKKNQVDFNLRLQEVMPTSQLWLLFHEISWSTRNCYWLVGLFHFQYWTLGQGERRQLKSNYAEVGLRLPMISK